ncbi:MAG: YbaB/EbfC family nucleoid-associated protein [Mycoplasmoidaceae bacterium]
MNIQNLMKQAQKMQADIEKKTNEFNKKEFEFKIQNDLIVITILGNLEIKNIKINEDLIDKDDIDTLQDLLIEAINKATSEVQKEKEKLMPSVPKGFM